MILRRRREKEGAQITYMVVVLLSLEQWHTCMVLINGNTKSANFVMSANKEKLVSASI